MSGFGRDEQRRLRWGRRRCAAAPEIPRMLLRRGAPRCPPQSPQAPSGSEFGGRDPTGSGAAVPPQERRLAAPRSGRASRLWGRDAPPRSGERPLPALRRSPLSPRCPKSPTAAEAPIPPGRARRAGVSRQPPPPSPERRDCRALPFRALPCHIVPCRAARSPHARPHVGGRGSGAGGEGAAAAEPHVGWVGAASPAARSGRRGLRWPRSPAHVQRGASGRPSGCRHQRRPPRAPSRGEYGAAAPAAGSARAGGGQCPGGAVVVPGRLRTPPAGPQRV